MDKRNIALLGFMGTGKTAVGRRVAARLGMRFLDMDAVIEERAGKSVSDIFAQEGEARFRAMERALIRELAAGIGMVIATGGGVVLNADNVADLDGSGLVVCLTAEPKTIVTRVSRGKHRPLLEGDDKERRVLALLESRKALYGAIPLRVDTTALTVEQVADRVIELWNAGAAALRDGLTSLRTDVR